MLGSRFLYLDRKRVRPILGGIKSHIFARPIDEESVGGNVYPRYCYSVYLRHLVMLHQAGLGSNPAVVAELGPGNSIGTGIAALLAGANEYHGLDAVAYRSMSPDSKLFDGILDLLQSCADIPSAPEFPEAKPPLASYAFPREVLSPERLSKALAPDRVERIRRAYQKVGERQGEILFRYVAPWTDPSSVPLHSVDLVFSQATMEHVENVDATYAAAASWLKPGGCMSHQVDFRSHGLASDWNGHWAYSDLVFWMAKGKRPYLLNRQAMSEHLALAKRNGFETVSTLLVAGGPGVSREHLAPRFRHLTEEDLKTSGMYFAARHA